MLPQRVVQFSRETLALGLLRFDQLVGEGLLGRLAQFQLRDAIFEDAIDGPTDGQTGE